MLTLNRGLYLLTATALLATSAMARPEVRDPFVNQNAPYTQATSGRSAPVVRPVQGNPANAPSQGKAVVSQPQVTKVVVAPDVMVSGIISSQGSRQAILSTGERSFLVREGQRLADFKVKAISAGSVTLDYEGQSFKIPMAKGT